MTAMKAVSRLAAASYPKTSGSYVRPCHIREDRCPKQTEYRSLHLHTAIPLDGEDLAALMDITKHGRQMAPTEVFSTSEEAIEQHSQLQAPGVLIRDLLFPHLNPRHDRLLLETVYESLPDKESVSNCRLPMPSFPMNGTVMPHPVFRAVMKNIYAEKQIRRILAEQLLRCDHTRDILRVVAVAMQRKRTARELPNLHESIRRAMYRARPLCSDTQILQSMTAIILRFKAEGCGNPNQLLQLGVRFAARARKLHYMKRYLTWIKESGTLMSAPLFRAIIAKFSVGVRGLGEIRNGRWQRRDLLQVLLGFDGTSVDDACHLGFFLRRDDWSMLHAYVCVLARCRASDEIWKEWLLWLDNPARWQPRSLSTPDKHMSTRLRGDSWFIEQMVLSGDFARAWQMLDRSGMQFKQCRAVVRTHLIDSIDHATICDEDARAALLDKYSLELKKIESAIGLVWVQGKHGENGYHATREDMEDSLELLSEPNFVLDPGYGYPWDEPTPDEMEADRKLMEAKEI